MQQYSLSPLVLLNVINSFYFKLLCSSPPSPFDDFKGAIKSWLTSWVVFLGFFLFSGEGGRGLGYGTSTQHPA